MPEPHHQSHVAWDHAVMFLGLGQVGAPHLLYPQHRTTEEPGEETNSEGVYKAEMFTLRGKSHILQFTNKPRPEPPRASHAPAEILIPSPPPTCSKVEAGGGCPATALDTNSPEGEKVEEAFPPPPVLFLGRRGARKHGHCQRESDPPRVYPSSAGEPLHRPELQDNPGPTF